MKIKLIFILPWIVVVLLNCTIIERVGEPRYYALSIFSDTAIAVWNLNRYLPIVESEPESESPAVIMAEAGDLFYINNSDIELFYRYDPRDGQHLSFTFDLGEPVKTFLNGKLICLDLHDDPSVWEWIEACDERSLKYLRSLNYYYGSEEENPQLSVLQKIAKVRPEIGLYFEETSHDTDEIISLFTPTWLVALDELQFNEEEIPRLRKLECLFTGSSENTQFIENLPNLETLILNMDYDTADIHFNKIPKLRSLSLSGCIDIGSLTTFSNRNKLRNLNLIDCEIEDFSPIYTFPQLTGLGFYYCEGTIDLSELQYLSSLRWFSFPPEVSQSEFSKFLLQHPKLKVVELIGCDEINDLSPLARLKEIQGLSLDITVENPLPLYQLTDLEVLILGEDAVDEEEYKKLQAALPNTQIVTGYCLGSGWILLMIPFIVVGSLIIHRSRRRTSR